MKDKYKIVLYFVLLFLVGFSIYFLKPQIAGDSLLYTSSIDVLRTGVKPAGFVPMMMTSTLLGLRLIMLFEYFIHNISVSWLLLNSILYIVMGLFSYSLFKRVTVNPKIAFWGTLFLMTNYAIVSFGLGYLIDMGGWTAYMASLYFSYKYLESEVGDKGNKYIYYASLAIGIGGLYKEYAFVAYFVVFGVLIFRHWKSWLRIIQEIAITGLISFLPFLILNTYTYLTFDYTYIDWLIFNHGKYAYQHRLVEFIKSFGSIYTFGWFLFLPGFYVLLKRTREILKTKIIDKGILFIWLTLFSCLSILLWPVVTRVLYITMPAVVMVSILFLIKLEERLSIKKFYYVLIPILIFYAVSSYLMDAYILNFVNLPF